MNRNICKYLTTYTTALFLATILSTNAFALDIKEAKEQGLIGETATGYIALVSKGNSEAVKLVQEVNKQRKAVYEKIARDNGISLQAVELRAAEKAFQKTPAGQYIQTNGTWTKK